MAVLGREHLDIWDLDIDSLTLSRSLNPLELFFDIPRAPVLSLKTPTHLVVQNQPHQTPASTYQIYELLSAALENCGRVGLGLGSKSCVLRSLQEILMPGLRWPTAFTSPQPMDGTKPVQVTRLEADPRVHDFQPIALSAISNRLLS